MARLAGARAARRSANGPPGGLSGLAPLPRPDWRKPDIIEFICSDQWLDRGRTLYPRQATLLKLIFLQKDLLTEYDYDVLEEWSSGFRLPDVGDHEKGDRDDLRFEPTRGIANGITPDWEQRMDICIAEGRPWFREVMPVVGRRGSKGMIGGYSGARVLSEYIWKADPQDHFGIDRDKKLQGIVFAGKKEQAKVNQWQDIVNVILGSPFLSKHVSKPLGESLSIYAPGDYKRQQQLEERGVFTDADIATFLLIPKESTLMAGRGPTSFMQFYDEMAHVVATGANRSAEEVYQAATPALDQFGVYGFIYSGSSPWQMTGQLYENYLQALAVDPVTRMPIRPEMLMVQLASWDLYKDWEYASDIAMVPGDHKRTFASPMTRTKLFIVGGDRDDMNFRWVSVEKTEQGPVALGDRRSGYAGMTFNPLKGAIQEYDDQMRRLEKANPDTFKVERLSQWATALDAYLDPEQIAKIFESWYGENDSMRSKGQLSIDYYCHGDPSESGDNFGWAVAHRVGPDDDGLYHVVFDKLHAWIPSEFPDGKIDYLHVEKEIIKDGKAFVPNKISFDQFSGPGTIQRIRKELNEAGLPRHVTVTKKAATGPLNWIMAETFKTAMNMGLIHAPYHELAELELRFLQKSATQRVDHPSSGPVQTKDVADAMFNVVHELIGDQMGAYLRGDLASFKLSATAAGGIPTMGERSPDESTFSRLSNGTSIGRPGDPRAIAMRQRAGRR